MSVKHGDYRAICDVCGRRFWFSELKPRWDGFYCDQACWEPYHDGDRSPTISEKERGVEVARPRYINTADDAAEYTPVTADTAVTGLWYTKS